MTRHLEGRIIRLLVELLHENRRIVAELQEVKAGVDALMRRPVRLRLTLGEVENQISTEEEITQAMTNFQLGDSQKVRFAIAELDAAGNPAALAEGDVLTVESSDTESLTVVMDETPVEGSSASGFLVAGKKLATGVTATATLVRGDLTLTAVDTLDIVAGQVASLSFGLGAPVNQ